MARLQQKYRLGIDWESPHWIGRLCAYLLILLFTAASAYAYEDVNVWVDGSIGRKPPNVVILDTQFEVIKVSNTGDPTRWIRLPDTSKCKGLKIDNIVVIKSTEDSLIGKIQEINCESACVLTLGEASLAEAIQEGELNISARMVITGDEVKPDKILRPLSFEGSGGSFLRKVATQGVHTNPSIYCDPSSWNFDYGRSILFPHSEESSTTASIEARVAIIVDYKLSLRFKGGVLEEWEASATSCQTGAIDFDAKSKLKIGPIPIWSKETGTKVFNIGWLPIIAKGIGSLNASASSSAAVNARLFKSESAVDVRLGQPGGVVTRNVKEPKVKGPQIKDAKIDIEGSLIPELKVEFYGALGTSLKAETTARVEASARNGFSYSLKLVAGVEPVLGKDFDWTLWSYSYP